MAFAHNRIPPRLVAFLLFTTLLVGIDVTITHTVAFSQHPATLSAGIVFDLFIVTTVAFYWFVARPLRLPSSRVWLLALLMLRVALFILPETSFFLNPVSPFLFLLIEGVVLIVAGLRIRTIRQTYQRLRPTTDAETALRGSLATVFGKKAAGAIIGEGLILYYVVWGWRLQSDLPARATPLTTHRESGQITLTIVLLMVGLIELFGVHLLLTRWNPTVAFWVSGFSGYGLLFLAADAIATLKRPSYLTDDQLHIRLGVRWKATIPHTAIATVLLIHDKPKKRRDQLNGAFLTAPNVLLTVHEPILFSSPYGTQKEITRFSFFVDDRENFVQQLGAQ